MSTTSLTFAPGRSHLTAPFVLGFVLSLFPSASRADLDVATSMNLGQLQILPASGTLFMLPGVLASASAQAQDSLGGADAQSNTVVDDATWASAVTALANAHGTASAPALNGSASGGVHIPQITAFASSAANGDPFGSLFGQFEIVGTTGPVSVQLKALLDYSQSLSTTGYGLSAFSEVIFNLLLPDLSGDPVLFFDNPLTIGPNDFTANAGAPTLSTFVTLQPDTPYLFIAGVDAESSGVSQVPEPSSLFLTVSVFVFSALLFARRERGRLRHSATAAQNASIGGPMSRAV
jgi:hypothetical protein